MLVVPIPTMLVSSSHSHSHSRSHQLICALLLVVSAVAVTATDHIVGANRGWNPGINFTLWSNNQTFYVGNLISFRYEKNQYNVFEVNQTGYDNCTTEGAVGNWSKGKDFIPLNEAKRYYFICGNDQCFNGMKVSVLVHPLPSPTPTTTNHSSTTHVSAAPLRFQMGPSFSALFFFFFGLVSLDLANMLFPPL